MFQSSFELTGYITMKITSEKISYFMFQSSFELTGYITEGRMNILRDIEDVSKLFRAYRLYNRSLIAVDLSSVGVSKLFRAYRLYNNLEWVTASENCSFKALSSLQVI